MSDTAWFIPNDLYVLTKSNLTTDGAYKVWNYIMDNVIIHDPNNKSGEFLEEGIKRIFQKYEGKRLTAEVVSHIKYDIADFINAFITKGVIMRGRSGNMSEDREDNLPEDVQEGFIFRMNGDEVFPDGEYLLYTVEDGIGQIIPTTELSFEDALDLMRYGYKMRRTGWHSKDMWIAILDSIGWSVTDEIKSSTENAKLESWIGMKTVQGTLVPWSASHTDLLSEDWELVQSPVEAEDAPKEDVKDDTTWIPPVDLGDELGEDEF